MFYAPESWEPKNESPIVEGEIFKDITVRCGTHIGWSRGRRSLYLDTVRDVRPLSSKPVDACGADINSPYCDVISFKLYYLEEALSAFAEDYPSGTDTYAELASIRQKALDEFTKGNTRKLIRHLDAFLEVADDWVPDADVPPSVPAELKERAASTIFMACKLVKGKKPKECNLSVLADHPEHP
jgi:hypothetical protein